MNPLNWMKHGEVEEGCVFPSAWAGGGGWKEEENNMWAMVNSTSLILMTERFRSATYGAGLFSISPFSHSFRTPILYEKVFQNKKNPSNQV